MAICVGSRASEPAKRSRLCFALSTCWAEARLEDLRGRGMPIFPRKVATICTSNTFLPAMSHTRKYHKQLGYSCCPNPDLWISSTNPIPNRVCRFLGPQPPQQSWCILLAHPWIAKLLYFFSHCWLLGQSGWKKAIAPGDPGPSSTPRGAPPKSTESLAVRAAESGWSLQKAPWPGSPAAAATPCDGRNRKFPLCTRRSWRFHRKKYRPGPPDGRSLASG